MNFMKMYVINALCWLFVGFGSHVQAMDFPEEIEGCIISSPDYSQACCDATTIFCVTNRFSTNNFCPAVLSADGNTLVLESHHRTVGIYRKVKGQPLNFVRIQIIEESKNNFPILISEDGNTLVFSLCYGSVKIYHKADQKETFECVQSLEASADILSILMSEDGRTLVFYLNFETGCATQKLRVYHRLNQSLPFELVRDLDGLFYSYKLSDDGSTLLVVLENGMDHRKGVVYYDEFKHFQELVEIDGFEFSRFSLSADGRIIVLSPTDGVLNVYRRTNENQPFEFVQKLTYIGSEAFGPLSKF